MPGTLMAMARLNRPSLMIYGGTIKPGVSTETGGLLDIVSAFQSYGVCWVCRCKVQATVCVGYVGASYRVCWVCRCMPL